MNEEALKELENIRGSVDRIIALLSGAVPGPVVIQVKKGDNLISLINDNLPYCTFELAPDFVQDVGTVNISKPAVIRSSLNSAKLIGSITAKVEDVVFDNISIDGIGSTIITTGLRTLIRHCILNGSLKGQHRGVAANSKDVIILFSSILNIWKDIDTQAIWGADGTDNLIIDSCELEASGENIMFGGADSNDSTSIPKNITINNCHLFKNQAWKTQPGVGCKNLFELKCVNSLRMVNCILEYSFSDAQTGFGIVLTVRNQGGKAPWSNITNVVIEDNIIRHVGSGVQILGRDDLQASGIMNNIVLKNNKFEDVNKVLWGGGGRSFQVSGGPKNLILQGNVVSGNKINSALLFDQQQFKCEGLVISDNEFVEGNYGIFGTGAPSIGVAVLDMYAPGYIWSGNKVHKSGVNNVKWPTGTTFI